MEGQLRVVCAPLRASGEAAFLASAGAAAIHFAAAPSHLMTYKAAAVFMIATGVAQSLWALAILRMRSDRVAVAGIALNASILLVWLQSRTIGVPFGPMHGVPEDIHSADALATALEIIVIIAVSRVGQRKGYLLAAVAAAGVVASTIVSAHDPARERATALAVLLLIGCVRALITVKLVPLTVWRRTDEVTLGHLVPAHFFAPARAGVGAGG